MWTALGYVFTTLCVKASCVYTIFWTIYRQAFWLQRRDVDNNFIYYVCKVSATFAASWKVSCGFGIRLFGQEGKSSSVWFPFAPGSIRMSGKTIDFTIAGPLMMRYYHIHQRRRRRRRRQMMMIVNPSIKASKTFLITTTLLLLLLTHSFVCCWWWWISTCS